MKKLMLLACFALSAMLVKAQPPQQQQPPSIEERLKKTNEVMQAELQPNAEQKKTIETAFKTFFTAADKLTGNNPPNNQNLKQIELLAKDRDTSIKKVLTAAQFKKYEAAAKKLQPPKPGGQGQRGDGPPPPSRN